MPLISRRALCAALLFTTAPALRAQIPRASLDSIVARYVRELHIPAASVIALRGDSIVYEAHLGGATRASVYQLGSISKQFLAAGVMRLVERGAVALDDPVSRHLPGFPALGDSVRVWHLLQQTSGVQELFTLPGYGSGIVDTTLPTAELLAMIARAPLGFAPGSRWSYSNSNYTLLAALVERVAGAPYEDVLARELFTPLSLASLRQCMPLPAGAVELRGHTRDGDRITPSEPENMHWIRGDGGLCGTALDLARWMRALSAGRILAPVSWRTMTRPRVLPGGPHPAYGFGISLVPLDRVVPRLSHGGRMAGFTGTVAHYPEASLTIVALTNLGGVWIESLEQAMARRLLRRPEPTYAYRPLAESLRRAAEGRYEIGVPGVELRLRDVGGTLVLDAPPPAPSGRLRHIGGGRFVSEREPDAVHVELIPSRQQRVNRFALVMAGMRWDARRTTRAP